MTHPFFRPRMSDEDWLRRFERHHARRKKYGIGLLVCGVGVGILLITVGTLTLGSHLTRPSFGSDVSLIASSHFWLGVLAGARDALPSVIAFFLGVGTVWLVTDRRQDILLRIAAERRESGSSTWSEAEEEILTAAEHWIARRPPLVAGSATAALILLGHTTLRAWHWSTVQNLFGTMGHETVFHGIGVMLGFFGMINAGFIAGNIVHGTYLLYRSDRTGALLLRLVREDRALKCE
jgi:hypothetical protein